MGRQQMRWSYKTLLSDHTAMKMTTLRVRQENNSVSNLNLRYSTLYGCVILCYKNNNSQDAVVVFWHLEAWILNFNLKTF
jgi:hypothetical protein